ncbi:hypothetical protein P872_01685 [Rhodonellum psychrophilum GCM71 = DSM 17998]|uniref:Uncharacterized protein n=1 Tax=Rhodonellum psychrophilum GCM71 = DSM 17998 TaxID=1123057 RepID=U5BTQ2_9BACT|nr:hypothetical protein P872_01685 [Rhodonellum psychrophilum GCM71 = DSM 17998]
MPFQSEIEMVMHNTGLVMAKNRKTNNSSQMAAIVGFTAYSREGEPGL